jgi:2-polyprenyl-3-methyl-5-hydroxy-6-metoxy-1,4-benzoquinol methylase
MQPGTVLTTERIAGCNSCGSPDQILVGRSPDFEYETCANEFDFVECGACGLVYLRDRPTVDQLDVIYPPSYIPHRFEEHLGGFISRLRNQVQRRKVKSLNRHLPPHSLIMDVGPGTGEFLELLGRFGDPSWELCGVDFSEEAVRSVRELGIEAVHARFEALDWHGPAPAAITMNQVIEHLDDPAAVLAKAHQMLAPNGVIFIETPSIDGWDYRIFRRRYWGGWHTPRHWVLYNETTLGDLMERSGFAVVEVDYLLSPNFWLQSVHHMVSEKWRSPRLARWSDVSVLPSLIVASCVDFVQRALRGRTSNFRMVGRKIRMNGAFSDRREDASR